MTDSAQATRPAWLIRSAAAIGVVLIIVGVGVAITGQRLLASENRPTKQYVDGRYWTIDPGSCAALADSKAACIALDSAAAEASDRSHQNLVTVRDMGVLSVVIGVAFLFLGFVGTRRAAESSV